jgi:hypothetical protein
MTDVLRVMANVCGASATAVAGPQPAISIYPNVASNHGTQTITLAVVNHTAAPIAVCGSEADCLTIEIKDAHGTWVAWEAVPGAAPTPSANDLVVIGAGESRDVFAIPVVRIGTTRDFTVGRAHRVAHLPSKTDYRFTYALDAAARAAFATVTRTIAAGPEHSSASPMKLLTLDDAEIAAAVKAGEPGVSAYVRAGDVALLKLLDPLLDSADFAVASSAMYCVIATEVPEAADRLLRLLAHSDNEQLRSYATHGFLTIHPRVLAPKLLAALATETSEYVTSGLVLGIGAMDDPTLLPQLRDAHTHHPAAPTDLDHPDWGTEFELAGARLGDPAAIKALGTRAHAVAAHMRDRDGALADLFRQLPYTHSAAVAQMLTEFFVDKRGGSRNAPERDGPPPRDAAAAKAMADAEARAYVRVADDALWAITQIFPDEAWGLTGGLRGYTDDEQQRVKAIVARRLAAPRP